MNKLLRLDNPNPCVINLDHVKSMDLIDKRILFNFGNMHSFIDFESASAANEMFEKIISRWSRET